MIFYATGNLLEAKTEALVNTVNCVGITWAAVCNPDPSRSNAVGARVHSRRRRLIDQYRHDRRDVIDTVKAGVAADASVSVLQSKIKPTVVIG